MRVASVSCVSSMSRRLVHPATLRTIYSSALARADRAVGPPTMFHRPVALAAPSTTNGGPSVLKFCSTCMRQSSRDPDKRDHLRIYDHLCTHNTPMTVSTYYRDNRTTILNDVVHHRRLPAMLGLEYVVEIYSDAAPPRYLCRLCNQSEDFVGIQTHIVKYPHRLKYIKEHFPFMLSHMIDYLLASTPRVAVEILRDVCERLDRMCGRLKPYSLNESQLHLMDLLVGKLEQIDHHDEYDHEDVLDVIEHDRILALLAGRTGNSPDNGDPDWDAFEPMVAMVKEELLESKSIQKGRIPQLFGRVLQNQKVQLRNRHLKIAKDPFKHPLYINDREHFIYLYRRGPYSTQIRYSVNGLRTKWNNEWEQRLKHERNTETKVIGMVVADVLLNAIEEQSRAGWNGVRETNYGTVYADDQRDVEREQRILKREAEVLVKVEDEDEGVVVQPLRGPGLVAAQRATVQAVRNNGNTAARRRRASATVQAGPSAAVAAPAPKRQHGHYLRSHASPAKRSKRT